MGNQLHNMTPRQTRLLAAVRAETNAYRWALKDAGLADLSDAEVVSLIGLARTPYHAAERVLKALTRMNSQRQETAPRATPAEVAHVPGIRGVAGIQLDRGWSAEIFCKDGDGWRPVTADEVAIAVRLLLDLPDTDLAMAQLAELIEDDGQADGCWLIPLNFRRMSALVFERALDVEISSPEGTYHVELTGL